MPPSYQQNKEHIYKWIDKNRDKHNKLSAQAMVKYRFKCKNWKEIQKIYFNILLENI